MIDYGGVISSVDGIAAAFPHKILEKISGTPSRIDIDDVQEKQTENAASRPSTRGGGAHVHAGMVVPTASYVVEFSPTAYAWEPIPGEAPVYLVGITATAQRLLDNNFARAMWIYMQGWWYPLQDTYLSFLLQHTHGNQSHMKRQYTLSG